MSTPLRDMPGNANGDGYDSSSDDETLADTRARLLRTKMNGNGNGNGNAANWNDIPEDMVNGRKRSPRGNGRKAR